MSETEHTHTVELSDTETEDLLVALRLVERDRAAKEEFGRDAISGLKARVADNDTLDIDETDHEIILEAGLMAMDRGADRSFEDSVVTLDF